jgi:hypothetical protein
MAERNLIDILRDVDYWTNFTQDFGPLSGSDLKLDPSTESYLLTTFTYGCYLGGTQAARHMRGVVTSIMLTFVNQRHLSLRGFNGFDSLFKESDQALVDYLIHLDAILPALEEKLNLGF